MEVDKYCTHLKNEMTRLASKLILCHNTSLQHRCIIYYILQNWYGLTYWLSENLITALSISLIWEVRRRRLCTAQRRYRYDVHLVSFTSNGLFCTSYIKRTEVKRWWRRLNNSNFTLPVNPFFTLSKYSYF